MQGVEILSQSIIPVFEYGVWWTFPLCVLLCAFLILLVIKTNNPIWFLAILGVISILMPLDLNTKVKVGEYTEYKVILSQDVGFKEFTDKYEVISQDGKIYTIKERNDE